jgi:ABC-2 type transport system ATP-binding protein
MVPILEVRDLVKAYPRVRAVDGLSFSIRTGICFGLLGPNGAGKTTTIEMAESIISPTSGEILYKGTPRSPAFKEEIGIQFQSTSLLSFLTVRETLETFRSLYRRPMPMADLIELCQLHDILEQRNDRISGGQKQRLMISIALVNDPELLFLDEPTTGLDPQARRHLWEIVETIKAEGKTMILTTHYMEEAQILCDEIAIIDQGRIIAQGPPEALVREFCAGVAIRVPKENLSIPGVDLLAGTPQGEEGPQIYEHSGYFEFHTTDANRFLKRAVSEGIDLSGIEVRANNLEDLFLQLTGRQLRE